MTASKIDWSLSPTERECSGEIAKPRVSQSQSETPDAIKRVVGLITKAGGRREAA